MPRTTRRTLPLKMVLRRLCCRQAGPAELSPPREGSGWAHTLASHSRHLCAAAALDNIQAKQAGGRLGSRLLDPGPTDESPQARSCIFCCTSKSTAATARSGQRPATGRQASGRTLEWAPCPAAVSPTASQDVAGIYTHDHIWQHLSSLCCSQSRRARQLGQAASPAPPAPPHRHIVGGGHHGAWCRQQAMSHKSGRSLLPGANAREQAGCVVRLRQPPIPGAAAPAWASMRRWWQRQEQQQEQERQRQLRRARHVIPAEAMLEGKPLVAAERQRR